MTKSEIYYKNKGLVKGTKKCLTCGIRFNIYISRDIKRKKFCSRSCTTKFVKPTKTFLERNNLDTFPIEWRNNMRKKHRITPKLLEACRLRGLSKRGKNHPNWQGGITPMVRIRTSRVDWKELSFHVRNNVDRCKCFRCGISGKKVKLYAHHIIPWNIVKRDDEENLLTLCGRCHGRDEAICRKTDWNKELSFLIKNKYYPYPYIKHATNI